MRLKIVFYVLNTVLGAIVASLMFFIMDFVDMEVKKIDGNYSVVSNSLHVIDIVLMVLLLFLGTIFIWIIFLINRTFLKKRKEFQINSLTAKRGTIVAGFFPILMIGICIFLFFEMAFTPYESPHKLTYPASRRKI